MRVDVNDLEHRVPFTYDSMQIISYIPHIVSGVTRQKDNIADHVVDPTMKSCCSLLLKSLQALLQLVLVQDSNNSKKAVVDQCIVQWATLLVHLMHWFCARRQRQMARLALPSQHCQASKQLLSKRHQSSKACEGHCHTMRSSCK